MPTNSDLLAIGDCSIDLHMRVDEDDVELSHSDHPKMCFLHGSKIPVKNMESVPAGNSCHIAVGVKMLGVDAQIYTEVGDDENGDKFIKLFQSHQIDHTFCLKNSGCATNVHAVISAGNDRTIFSYHEKRNYQMQKWPTPSWIHYSTLAPGFEPFQEELIKYINANPKTGIAFNPGSSQMKNLNAVKEFLTVTDILFVNDEEASRILETSLSNSADLKQMHMDLQKLGPKLTVITTGEKGSTSYDGKTFIQMDIYDDGKPVEKTGVGDAYSSGFLAAIISGKSMLEAMKWGTFNSQGVTRYIGGLKGLRTKQELEEMTKSIKLNYKEL